MLDTMNFSVCSISEFFDATLLCISMERCHKFVRFL